MTATALTHLPLAAGSALAAAAGRAALWGMAKYAKAPLSNTAILALATFSVLAGSNALYFQNDRHPSPLFGPAGTQVADVRPVPVVPAVRKVRVPALPTETTGSVAVKPAVTLPPPIGNAEVFELQRKLMAFGLFEGKVDGFYGPKTAGAIKRFEERHGLKIKGELTRAIVDAILAAPIITQAPVAKPIAAPEPVPETPNLATEVIALEQPAPVAQPAASVPEAAAEPLALLEPLPAPAPLQPVIGTAAVTKPAAVQRPLPETPGEAMDIASDVAEDAIDAVIAAVQGRVQLGPAQPLPAKPEPVETATVALEPAPTADPVADIVAAETMPPAAAPSAKAATDPNTVSRVQLGLANLGFLHAPIDGVAGEATAKAIRNFEVYFNYDVTGRVTAELVDLLSAAGAYT